MSFSQFAFKWGDLVRLVISVGGGIMSRGDFVRGAYVRGGLCPGGILSYTQVTPASLFAQLVRPTGPPNWRHPRWRLYGWLGAFRYSVSKPFSSYRYARPERPPHRAA